MAEPEVTTWAMLDRKSRRRPPVTMASGVAGVHGLLGTVVLGTVVLGTVVLGAVVVVDAATVEVVVPELEEKAAKPTPSPTMAANRAIT